MKIALDAMGGDHAPQEIILGALEAAPHLKCGIILVGNPTAMAPFLPAVMPHNVEIVEASEAVGMEEKPMEAYRKKKDSSMMVGVNLVAEGKADAFVSAGNTGAASATSLLKWRQIEGFHRPAIAVQLPNRHNGFVLLDAGASPDVEPNHLLEFALLGRSYCQRVMGRPEPSVHLLNIGEEEGKGNSFAKQAYSHLSKSPWFKGNIEGKDIFNKPCDVIVCDAFVGNVVLKTSEGVAELFMTMIRDAIPKNKVQRLMYLPLRKIMGPVRKKADYAESGGSPLLGLNGLCIICHGRSSAKAIKNALFQAELAIDNDLVGTMRLAGKETLEVPTGGE